MSDRKPILDYGKETSPPVRILEHMAIFLSLCVGMTMLVLFIWGMLEWLAPGSQDVGSAMRATGSSAHGKNPWTSWRWRPMAQQLPFRTKILTRLDPQRMIDFQDGYRRTPRRRNSYENLASPAKMIRPSLSSRVK